MKCAGLRALNSFASCFVHREDYVIYVMQQSTNLNFQYTCTRETAECGRGQRLETLDMIRSALFFQRLFVQSSQFKLHTTGKLSFPCTAVQVRMRSEFYLRRQHSLEKRGYRNIRLNRIKLYTCTVEKSGLPD